MSEPLRSDETGSPADGKEVLFGECISIINSELEGPQGDQYFCYTISVVYRGLQWQVTRRFSDFHVLYLALCDLYDEKYVPDLPQRRPLASFVGLDTRPEFGRKRSSQLQKFLRKCLDNVFAWRTKDGSAPILIDGIHAPFYAFFEFPKYVAEALPSEVPNASVHSNPTATAPVGTGTVSASSAPVTTQQLASIAAARAVERSGIAVLDDVAAEAARAAVAFRAAQRESQLLRVERESKAVTGAVLERLHADMSAAADDDAKCAKVAAWAHSHVDCTMSAAAAARCVSTCFFSKARLAVATALAPRIYDVENVYVVLSSLWFDSDAAAVLPLLHSASAPTTQPSFS